MQFGIIRLVVTALRGWRDVEAWPGIVHSSIRSMPLRCLLLSLLLPLLLLLLLLLLLEELLLLLLMVLLLLLVPTNAVDRSRDAKREKPEFVPGGH